MTERAIGLTDNAEFTLRHCGELMIWNGSHTGWSGPPGDGVQNNDAEYRCEVCGAVARVTLTEPC